MFGLKICARMNYLTLIGVSFYSPNYIHVYFNGCGNRQTTNNHVQTRTNERKSELASKWQFRSYSKT